MSDTPTHVFVKAAMDEIQRRGLRVFSETAEPAAIVAVGLPGHDLLVHVVATASELASHADVRALAAERAKNAAVTYFTVRASDQAEA